MRTRCFLTLLALLPGAAAAADAHPGASAYGLFIERGNSLLVIHGIVSSAGHERILRETAARDFAGSDIDIRVRIGNGLPPGWSLLTDLTLRAVSHTQSGSASITPAAVSLHGYATDANAWLRALSRVESSLPAGVDLNSAVTLVVAGQSIDSLCRQLFAAAFRTRKIRFRKGSVQLSSSAYPLLDEMVELGTDCPAAHIEVSGSGDGGIKNGQTGLQRAEAVVAYLRQRGLDGSRLEALAQCGLGKPPYCVFRDLRRLIAAEAQSAHLLKKNLDIRCGLIFSELGGVLLHPSH